jgi:MarR family 2-MHQ and catechol resistance regulon transcriptional repressor
MLYPSAGTEENLSLNPEPCQRIYLDVKNLDIKIDSSGVHVWLVLAKASRALAARADRSIAGLGMCGSDFGALEVLLHKGPLPVNTLGRKLLLTSGSITTAIDRLEERGLVTRRNDPEDRRARIVHLTPAGRAMIQKAFAAHAADMERAVAVLTGEERAVLIGLLKRLGRSNDGEIFTAEEEL